MDTRQWVDSVYAACAKRMERYAMNYLYAYPELLPDAQEFVLEAFMRMFEHRKKLMRHDNIEAWLMKMLQSILKNAIRKLRNRQNALGTRIDMDRVLQSEGMYLQPDITNGRSMMEICDILQRDLTPDEYRLFEFSYLSHLSPQEIADKEGISANTVYQKQRRLRKKIQAALLKED